MLFALLLCLPAPANSIHALPQDRPATESTSEERRILSLADGRKLRAVARQRADGWEVRDGNLWLVLPEGLVTSVESEREVLARLRDLASRVPPDDLARKVALAEWMVQQGLLSEALQALDQILAVDPDHPAARALIARAAIPVAFPRAALDAATPTRERIDALLRFGAQARPALRELVAAKLVSLGEPGLLKEALVQETQNGVTTRRDFAVFALRRAFPGGCVRELLARATLDPAADVRADAALGLKLVESPARIVPLVHVLARDEASARIHAVEALGTLADPAALEPLVVHLARMSPAAGGSSGGAPRAHVFVGNHVGYLRDFDVQIAQGSSIADPIPDIATEGTQLDVRVTGVGVESVTPAAERRAICRALARISGEKQSDDPARWMAWWKQRTEAAEHKGGTTPR